MFPLGSASIIDDRPSLERRRRPRSKPLRFAVTVVVAALMTALGFVPDRLRIVQAGALPQADSKYQPAADSSGLVARSRERLDKLQEEILDLGAQVLGRLEKADRPGIEDAIINQRIRVQSSEGNFENAKLTREVAEIAILEYEEGIFKQDLSTAEGEILLARNNWERARDSIEATETRLAKIKKASRGTAEDVALEFSFEDNVVQAVLREPRARVELEKAKSKLELLRQFARPKRVKELKSEFEKARSDELAKQAQWELEKLKLKKLQEAAKTQDRDPHEHRVPKLLDQALPIAEQLKAKLDRAEKDREPDDQLCKEIAGMTGQLQAVVEQAQAEDAAAKWATLKPKVHAAAIHYPVAKAK